MNNEGTADRRNAAGTLLTALMVFLLLQIVFYPALASWTHKALTGKGWDGSGLRYFQLFRILPTGLILAAALAGSVAWAASRMPTRATRLALVAWAVELLLFLVSVAWYAAVVGGRPG